MILIIGLGNPGKRFESTPHSVGFLAVDEFAKKNNFPEFKFDRKSDALVSEQIMGEEKIMLVKPQTFMNESGKAIKSLLPNNPADSIIVVHDDIDLPLGKIKIIQERGSAGHKGVESIIKNIGNEGLIRLRIGIAPEKKPEAKAVVLKKFSDRQQIVINSVLQKVALALDLLIKEGLDKAMNEYNK